MKKYVIKNGEYYLSNQYEKAAELVLGFGYVFAKDNIREFTTKSEASKMVNTLKRQCGYRSLEIKEIESKPTLKDLDRECTKLSKVWIENPTPANWTRYQKAYKEWLKAAKKIAIKKGK